MLKNVIKIFGEGQIFESRNLKLLLNFCTKKEIFIEFRNFGRNSKFYRKYIFGSNIEILIKNRILIAKDRKSWWKLKFENNRSFGKDQ